MKCLRIKRRDGSCHIVAYRGDDETTTFRFTRLIDRKTRDVLKSEIRLSDVGFAGMNQLWSDLRNAEYVENMKDEDSAK